MGATLRGMVADRFADGDLATGENAWACKAKEPTRQIAGSTVNLMLNFLLVCCKVTD
jgi:hypothetical protein